MATITVAVEGATDVSVIKRIFTALGHELAFSHGLRGKLYLDRNLNGYNSAARFAPWLVLRDLDHDAPCPSELIRRLLPQPSPQMMFRICVREVESWLLADHESLATFIGVRVSRVPADPDTLDDPKATVVNLARHSRIRAIREDMVPAEHMSGTTGPAYSSRIAEFVREHWRPEVASARSTSLRRCIDRLTGWKPQ